MGKTGEALGEPREQALGGKGGRVRVPNQLVGDASESDVNKIYQELTDAQPGNDQGQGSFGHRDSSASNHKQGSNNSDRSRGSVLSRRSLTRIGVANKGGVPAPACVKVYHDVLQQAASLPPSPQNQQKLIKLFQKLVQPDTIVQIRGLSRMVEDFYDTDSLRDLKSQGRELDPQLDVVKDTVMWNPLHYAVYQGHLEVVKFLKNEVKVNFGLTAPKHMAATEGEQVNDQEAFLEDVVMVL